MKVRLKHKWFAPSEAHNEGKLNQSSGRRYRPGVHEIPESMRELLPKSAVILDDKVEAPAPAPVEDANTLRDLDMLRVAGDVAAEKRADAELRANAEKLRKELEAEEATKPFKKKFGKE